MFAVLVSRSGRRALSTSSKCNGKQKVSWLDLRGCGLSAIERLCLEEALLRHDPHDRSWAIIGTHDPTHHTRLSISPPPPTEHKDGTTNRVSVDVRPKKNESCIIIMGIGGKPSLLLDEKKVREDGVLTIKRFTGGGTVVVDHSCLWTTFIGRTHHFPQLPPYPRDIMLWSANVIFEPVFRRMNQQMTRHKNKTRSTLVVDTKSCGMEVRRHVKRILPINNNNNNSNDDTTAAASVHSIPIFSVRENDYVLGERKIGGNAQSIVKGGWLHHTTFLWDYVDEHMEYLTLPNRRPDYRGSRSHSDFLMKLNTLYDPEPSDGTRVFFDSVKEAADDAFDLRHETLTNVMNVVVNGEELGGMQSWFDGKCRTRVVQI